MFVVKVGNDWVSHIWNSSKTLLFDEQRGQWKAQTKINKSKKKNVQEVKYKQWKALTKLKKKVYKKNKIRKQK